MAVTYIKRDGLARATLARCNYHEISGKRETCRWCGGAPGRFAYRWEQDSIGAPRNPWIGMFCSVSCYRSFVPEGGD